MESIARTSISLPPLHLAALRELAAERAGESGYRANSVSASLRWLIETHPATCHKVQGRGSPDRQHPSDLT
jgi:hypothetical protein